MKKLYLLLVWIFGLFVQVQAAGKHYTVIVSLDGFRWDYPEMYDTPFLDSLGYNGVQAVMQPSYPSKTFPNHYTLATGLYPDRHGIVANVFLDKCSGRIFSLADKQTKLDPYFYGGEPIWITAKNQGVKVGVVYWPGSDVKVCGAYPDYYQEYDKEPRLSFVERVAEIMRLLKLPEEIRPQLIMAYFEQPDSNGHKYGPQDKRTRSVVEKMDCLLGELWNGIRELPYGADVNLIVTSDHGMAKLSPDRVVPIARYVKKEWTIGVDASVPAMIYTKEGCVDSIMSALKDVPHIRAWKKADIPAYLHYGTHENIGDVVVEPDLGWLFTDDFGTSYGTHGYDPTYNDMLVPFRACGPDFKRGYIMKKLFPNVDIYSLLAYLLDIKPAVTDGRLDDIKEMLSD